MRMQIRIGIGLEKHQPSVGCQPVINAPVITLLQRMKNRAAGSLDVTLQIAGNSGDAPADAPAANDRDGCES